MLQTIILAAGKGTRMNTDHPKAIVPLCGKPMVMYVYDAVLQASKFVHMHDPIVIVGYRKQEVVDTISTHAQGDVRYVEQREILGTGYAVKIAQQEAQRKEHTDVLVLFADDPLITPETIQNLVQARRDHDAAFSFATVSVPNYSGDYGCFLKMGRVIRKNSSDGFGDVQCITEYKDATETEREIKELNVSVYCFDSAWLWKHIHDIQDNNIAKEFYLTDVVSIAINNKDKIVPVPIHFTEGMGANTLEELAVMEKYVKV